MKCFFLQYLQILFESSEHAHKVNVSTFIEILTTRSGPQLSKSESLNLNLFVSF